MTSTMSKSTKLSDIVKDILFIKGFDNIFTWEDYKYFKSQTKNAVHRAHAIAELFIAETNQLSDYAEYEF